MKHTRENEIEKEIERSQKSLRAAIKLLEEALLEDAISRTYYSILHAAKAVLLLENVTVSSHDAVKRLFGLHVIKTGKIAVKYSIILKEEQDDRYLTDYDTAFSPEKDRVIKRIEEARDFLFTMIAYLNNNGIKLESK